MRKIGGEQMVTEVKNDQKLTLNDLKKMAPDTIFAKGKGKILHPWWSPQQPRLFSDNDGMTIVNWVAIRGGIWDWAIYHSLDSMFEKADNLDGVSHLLVSWENIARFGSKLHKESVIRKFVLCDYEAFKMYRY